MSSKEDKLSKEELDRQSTRGSLFIHDSLSRNAARSNDLQAYLQVTMNLLLEKGMITQEEIESRYEEALNKAFDEGRDLKAGIQMRVDEESAEKVFEAVNCAERLHLCKGSCCKLDIILSAKEVESGKIRWDLGRPYMIRKKTDGYCCHNSDKKKSCSIYTDRPLSCRQYSCKDDSRIWKDFDKMIPNEEYVNHFGGPDDPKLNIG